MSDRKLKRQLNSLFRIAVMLVICAIIVYLFPKVGSFQYEYQKGMLWRYETLNAPFDFPIHKTEAELNEDRAKATREQSPIFNLKADTKSFQTNKFISATNRFRTPSDGAAIDRLAAKLGSIYEAGILQVPEKMDTANIRTVKIVENNIGRNVDFDQTYTLKKAYTALSEAVNQSTLPKSIKESILSLNLNNFLQENLEFDAAKTNLDQLNHLKNISLTQGMVQKGDVLIAKRELVTPEKIKLLNSLRQEYMRNAGSGEAQLRIIGGQIILTLTALLIFSVFFYYSKKRIFYKNNTGMANMFMF